MNSLLCIKLVYHSLNYFNSFVDRIEVTQKTTGATSTSSPVSKRARVDQPAVFPIHRWIKASTTLNVSRHDSCLPQDDPNRKQREKELSTAREIYTLSGYIVGAPLQVVKH